MSWTLLAINNGGPSTIHDDPGFFNGFGQDDALFVKSDKITYGVSAVPLPAALPLFLTALPEQQQRHAAANRKRLEYPAINQQPGPDITTCDKLLSQLMPP